MVEKTKYIEEFKRLYTLKNKTILSDELALEYFENLICLARTVTSHLSPREIITNKKNERLKL